MNLEDSPSGNKDVSLIGRIKKEFAFLFLVREPEKVTPEI